MGTPRGEQTSDAHLVQWIARPASNPRRNVSSPRIESLRQRTEAKENQRGNTVERDSGRETEEEGESGGGGARRGEEWGRRASGVPPGCILIFLQPPGTGRALEHTFPFVSARAVHADGARRWWWGKR